MIPEFDTIPEYFNIGVECTHPKSLKNTTKTAITVDNDVSGVRALSYGELDQLSNRFAHALDSLNLAKGERVLLWLPNCVEFPIAFFGSLKQGAVAVPASNLLTGEELEFLALDSGARILVSHPDLFMRLLDEAQIPETLQHIVLTGLKPEKTTTKIPVHSFNELLDTQADTAPDITTRADDPAYLVYTSGTTGYPKGVLHAHRALIGRLPAARDWFDYQGDDDIILHAGKFNWTYVLGTALMDPLFLGKSVVVYEGENDAHTWTRLIAKHQCTIFIGVPTIYRQILQKTDSRHSDVPTLRHCMCAGEHLSDEVLHAWEQRFEQHIYEAIGMSECSYYLSHHPSREIVPGSAGQPQRGHKIALLDSNLQPVPDNEEGMLCVELSDPGLFLEYWNLPEETRSSRKGNYFLTGDYARRDDNGNYWFLGRKDDIINSFGFRISPHEIERVIKSHDAVADCVVLAHEVETDKVLVVACVIPHEDSNLDEAAVTEFCSHHLAKYKLPKQVYFVESFPKTRNGKILRRQIRPWDEA